MRVCRDVIVLYLWPMCGRYSLTSPAESVRDLFGYDAQPNLQPRANIAPTQAVAAVRRGADDAPTFVWLRWGLIPSWAKDAAIGSRLINARAESVAEKPAFRGAFRVRRCLIAADGFYEWRKEGARRQPYRIVRRDGAPFAFAGLWDQWVDPASGEVIESCTIITTEANNTLRHLHSRMPVIFDPAAFDAWLNPNTDVRHVQALLVPAADDLLHAYPVSSRVNSPRNEDPDLIEPVALEEMNAPSIGLLL